MVFGFPTSHFCKNHLFIYHSFFLFLTLLDITNYTLTLSFHTSLLYIHKLKSCKEKDIAFDICLLKHRAMKVHEFSSSWDQHDSTSSLSLSCKRLRPLAPKLSGSSPPSPPSSSSGVTSATFDLKSFIRPDQTGPTKFEYKRDPPQVSSIIVHYNQFYLFTYFSFVGNKKRTYNSL